MKKITHSLLAAAVAMTPMVMSTTNVAAKTVSITKYGAKGNDKKDDTKAIQEALDKNKNATITFPKGTFYAKVLYLRGNQTLSSILKRKVIKALNRLQLLAEHGMARSIKTIKHLNIKGSKSIMVRK